MLSQYHPTTRFTARAEHYARYRPGYPTHILDTLEQEWNFTSSSVVVDIGSGTGIMSQMFLDNDNTVYAVEPNDDMRTFAEKWLSSYPRFQSVRAQGEATTLPSALCDMVVCAQSFHWLDIHQAQEEFRRILKPDGLVCAIWNIPARESAFGQDYEAFLHKYGKDYARLGADTWIQPEEMQVFFAQDSVRHYEFPNQQYFDFEGLQGRVLSNSFIPQSDEYDEYATMLHDLRDLYDRHAHKDMVVFRYQTIMYCGYM